MKIFTSAITLALALGLFMGTGAAANAKVKRNPFEYGQRVYKHYPRLNMIVISDTKRTAVIDGKKYQVGDRIGKYRLVGIHLDFIEFAHAKGVKRIKVHDIIK